MKLYVDYLKPQIYSALILSLLFCFNGNAQVGINTTLPDASSVLDVNSSNKGILVPRVDIPNLSVISPITGGSATGLLVYNTNATTGPGFFYWSGSRWMRIDGEKDWNFNGNSGTNPSTDYLGTTDNVGLRIKTNSTDRLEISNTGALTLFQSGSAMAPIVTWSGDSDLGLFRPGTDILGVSTTGSERLRIGANGNVGINNTSLLAKLEVVETGSTQASLYSHISNTGSNWSAVEGYNANLSGGAGMIASGFYGLYAQGGYGVAADGQIGVSGYGYAGIEGIPIDPVLDWAGYFWGDIGVDQDVYSTNYWIWSDERIKSKILNVENALKKVTQLKPVSYTKTLSISKEPFEKPEMATSNSWISRKNPKKMEFVSENEIGFLAQEVKEVLPELVKERQMKLDNNDTDSLYSVNYIGMIPILVKAIQEQQEQIQLLQEEIALLKAKK